MDLIVYTHSFPPSFKWSGLHIPEFPTTAAHMPPCGQNQEYSQERNEQEEKRLYSHSWRGPTNGALEEPGSTALGRHWQPLPPRLSAWHLQQNTRFPAAQK